MTYFSTLFDIIVGPYCLFVVILFAYLAKCYFLSQLIPLGERSRSVTGFLLISAIASSLFGDIAWILKLVEILFIPSLSYSIVTFSVRIAWAFLIIQYQSLALFIQSITYPKFKLHTFNKLCIAVSSFISIYFFYLAFFQANILSNKIERKIATDFCNCTEMLVMKYLAFYLIAVLVIPGLIMALRNARINNFPKIVRKQLKLFIYGLIIPYLCIEFLIGSCFNAVEGDLYPVVSISSILLLIIVAYCLKQATKLRFLNSTSHVQLIPDINIIEELKTALEQLSIASNLQELRHITQTFFKEALGIPLRNTNLIIRKSYAATDQAPHIADIEQKIEAFISSPTAHDFIQHAHLLIYDEIECTHFYQQKTTSPDILNFLTSIDADILVPIQKDHKIIAYITIAKNTRPNTCYNQAESNAMLVFSSYLSNTITLLQQKNIDMLVYRTKELHDELYYRHQEINQYKESINTFLRQTQQQSIGIVFYKNSTFTFGNNAAKELIKINLNTHEGHPLTKAFNDVAHRVEQYKTSYTIFAKNTLGDLLILSGVPHAQRNGIIITVVYPNISDVITKQLNELIDPADWDYVLYLASTNTGASINQLISGSGPTLLALKINLLKAALSKKALLLDMPDDDVLPTVERLHHLSLRETLHTINLVAPTKHTEIAQKLFGNNPLTNTKDNPIALLKSLDTTGTLFIKNIHFLDRETQQQLAEYISYGFYRIYNSDQKAQSSVRIICSSNQNIARLVQEGQFSDTLFNALRSSMVIMPSITTLTTQELYGLIDGFTDQAIKEQYILKNVLALSDKEKNIILQSRPVSLQELKSRVKQVLIKKVKNNQLQKEVTFDPAYEVTDPEIGHAARLGKQALKDQKILMLLWNKFKNQNKIATFLGVHRSSVYRRFKTYNISEESTV